MNKRDQLNEPTFGEKLSPVLVEIETAIWEHDAMDGDAPQYTNDGFRAACEIFISAISDRMFANDAALGCSLEYMAEHAKIVGNEIRRLVREHTNIDTYNLYKPNKS